MTGAALSEAQLIEMTLRFRQLEDRIEDAQLLLASMQEARRGCRGKIKATRDGLDACSELCRDDMVTMQDLIRKLQA